MTKVKTFKYGEESNQDAKLVFEKLSPSKSLSFLIYMGKIIGGTIGKSLTAFDGSKKLSEIQGQDIDISKIGDALFHSFERLDDKEFIEKLNLLFESVNHEGNQVHVDYLIFDGRPDLIFLVAKEALEVNYSRFLRGISGSMDKIKESIRIVKDGASS